MMFATEAEFVQDYIMRTRYNYEGLKKGPYEVTALINSAVGLLMIPKERCWKAISDDMIEPELLEQLKNSVIENTYGSELYLSEIVRHLRNAIAHAHLKFDAEKPPAKREPLDIKFVVFEDKRGNEHIKIKMDVDLLESFFIAFSEAIEKLNTK